MIVLKTEGKMAAEAGSKSPTDTFHWEKLLSFHPAEVCHRTEALYQPSHEGYLLPVYNMRVLVIPKTQKILRMEWNDKPAEEELSPFFRLMVLVYLTEAKDIKPTHTWVSEKELPVKELEDLYGKDPEAFLKAGKRLGGTEILYGDKGFALEVFPRVPLAYILWNGDQEFSPRAGVLFDSTIQSHLPLDIIWCMVSETTRRLLEIPKNSY
jgi:hypothetical protein